MDRLVNVAVVRNHSILTGLLPFLTVWLKKPWLYGLRIPGYVACETLALWLEKPWPTLAVILTLTLALTLALFLTLTWP